VSTLFISDLHLDSARPDITELFLRFSLREQASGARRVCTYWADLFEAWVGDDEPVRAGDIGSHGVARARRWRHAGVGDALQTAISCSVPALPPKPARACFPTPR